MTSRINRQNEIEAVWDGHDDEEYRRDQSHWRGHGRWDDESWLGLGRTLRRRVTDLALSNQRRVDVDGFGVVLEWGPGGGANLFALGPSATRLYGVDISEKNLGEAARQLAEFGEGKFVPLLLNDAPESIVPTVEEPVDLFFSSTVFQHFPSQQYGREVLEAAYRIMKPGALGYVQIRYDDGTAKYAPKSLEEYRSSHLFATSYAISDFWGLLSDVGFSPQKIANLNRNVNYAAFYFVKPRS